VDREREPGDEDFATPAEPERPRGFERVDTAVSPVVVADSVPLATGQWGVVAVDDAEYVEAELVETSEIPEYTDTGTGSIRWRPPGNPLVGWLALLAAIALCVVTGIAVDLGARFEYQTAWIVAWVGIGVSIIPIGAGLTAAILNLGRVPGIIATVVGVFANPWILLQVLRLLEV